MGQFDRQIATALRLIQKNGQSVSWKQTAITVPDAQKPWLPTSSAVVEYSPFICFLPFIQATPNGARQFLTPVGGGEAESGTFYGLMGAQSFTPDLKDVVTRAGVILDIESIEVLAPNGQNILYTITFNG